MLMTCKPGQPHPEATCRDAWPSGQFLWPDLPEEPSGDRSDEVVFLKRPNFLGVA